LCKHSVTPKDKGIECDICEQWFHCKCQNVSDETYKVLQKEKTLHWYCAGCQLGAARILEALAKVQVRMNNMDERMNEVTERLDCVSNDIVEMNRVTNELKTAIADLGQKLDSMDHIMDDGDKIKEAVKVSIEGHITAVTSKVDSVSKTLDEVRSKAIEERDRESRASNVIIYGILEPAGMSREESWKADRAFCLELFNLVLGIKIRDEDMKRFIRLGKKSETATGPRPVLIQFRDRVLKNMILESLGKLKDADDKYKQIIFAHDMTKEDRQECKRLVAEAKKRQSDDHSGEYLYRVRGAPGNLRIDKIRKRT
jgi:hypothetical protein